MTNIATLVRSARRSRRFSQRELARRAGLSQRRVAIAENADEDPRFDTASRLLAGAGHRLYAAATTRDDVAASAAEIRHALARGDRALAFRFFIQMNDHLVAERGLLRGILAITEPELTGWKTWDAAIAALVDYRLKQDGVPAPAGPARPAGTSKVRGRWSSIRPTRCRPVPRSRLNSSSTACSSGAIPCRACDPPRSR